MAVVSDLSRANLGAVLKTALDAVVVMRLDGTIAGWIHVARRTFSWSFADAVGRRMSELIIPHQYREAHERGRAHYRRTGREGPVLDRLIEITALHRDGHQLLVELSITHTVSSRSRSSSASFATSATGRRRSVDSSSCSPNSTTG